MNFGQAVELMKMGACVQRQGWNGKNMFVYLGKYNIPKFQPVFVMYNAQGNFQAGWIPSQADILAEDWVEVEVKDESAEDDIYNVTSIKVVGEDNGNAG